MWSLCTMLKSMEISKRIFTEASLGLLKCIIPDAWKLHIKVFQVLPKSCRKLKGDICLSYARPRDIKCGKNTYGGPLLLEVSAVSLRLKMLHLGGVTSFSHQEGLCNLESPENEYQGFSNFSRSYAHISIMSQRPTQKGAQTLHPQSHIWKAVQNMLLELVFQVIPPLEGWKLDPQRILIHTLSLSLSSYSSLSRGKSKLVYKGVQYRSHQLLRNFHFRPIFKNSCWPLCQISTPIIKTKYIMLCSFNRLYL